MSFFTEDQKLIGSSFKGFTDCKVTQYIKSLNKEEVISKESIDIGYYKTTKAQ